MIIEPLTAAAIGHVVYNMRDRDREEIAALGWAASVDLVKRVMLTRYGFVACTDDGTPVAVAAGDEHVPGLIGLTFFATARLPEIGLALSRHIKRTVIPGYFESGMVRRAEARSLEGYDWAARWMRSLGFRDLCVLRRFGKDGEDFILWELIDDDVRQSRSPEASAPSAAPDDRQRGRAHG